MKVSPLRCSSPHDPHPLPLCPLAAALLLLASGLPAGAQTTPDTANISGYVTNAGGESLPGVTVVIEDVERGVSMTRMTDQSGYFVLPNASPGMYSLRLTLDGHQEMVYEDIDAGPNARLRFEFELEPQVEVRETVTVSARAPAIETSEAAIKSTITYEEFDRLPVLSRNFQEVVDILPGVTKTGANFNIAGSRSNQNIFLIDGARNNDLSGTSERFSRSVYFIVASQNPDDPTVGLQTGFNLQSYNLDAIADIQVVTSAYSAEFGQGSGGVINLITRAGTDQLKGGVTFNYQDESLNDDESFDSLGRNQLSFSLGGPLVRGRNWYFVSYERDDYEVGFDHRRIAYPGEPHGAKIRSFVLDTDLLQSDTSQDRFASKFSFQLNDDNLLNLTVNVNEETSLFNQAINRPSVDQIEPRHGANDSISLLLNDYHTLSDRKFVHSLLRYGETDRRSRSDLGVDGYQPIIVNDAGRFIDYYVTGAFGEVLDAQLGVFEWKETLTWLMESHAAKFGFDWERFEEDLLVPARELYVSHNVDAAGNVIPVSGPVAPPEALFIFFSTGTPIDQQANVALNTYSAFGLDDWNINPRWTLSYGLRYDYDDFLKNHEFSPRIHTAYAASPRLVVRGGAGIFRDRSTLLSTEEDTVVRSRGIGWDKATGMPRTDPNVLPDDNVFLTDNFNSPITNQANIGFEYDLGNSYIFGANYIYKDFQDLVWTEIINKRSIEGLPTDPSIPVNSKLIGNFGYLEDQLLEVVFRKRFSRGAYFNVNYTFEDTAGNTSQEVAARNETVVNSIVEAESQNERRHPADYEVEHALKASGVFLLPWGVNVSTVAKYRTGRPWTPEERIGTPFAYFIAPEGINSRNLPDEFQWDVRLAKSFRFGNDQEIEIYGDVFNVTDRDNVRSVNQIITFAGYSEPTSFKLPRTVQLGIKYRH